MKTEFEFIGANPQIKCAELTIYKLKKPNEPFKEGETIIISIGEGKIKDKDDYDLLVSMLERNGNFKKVIKRGRGRPVANENINENNSAED